MKRHTYLILAALLLASCSAKAPAEPDAGTEAPAASETAASSAAPDYDKNVVRVDGTKLTVDGRELWINGVNTPWDKWNDFGGSFNEQFWDEHFARLHEEGVNASRVWVNCNGMNIVKLDADGNVTSVNEKHWTDLDKLFEIAGRHEIYLMPTLMSFDHFKDGNSGAAQWRKMVQSEAATKTYIDAYVVPFVQRYGGDPYLFCIDLCNEPDWIHENAECGKLDWEDLCKFFASEAAAIHENSDELVTVGLGMVKYNSEKYDGNYFSDEFLKSLAGEKAYLDVYTPHYYFWQNSWMGYPFETTPTDFGLDGTKPVVIGECAVVSESGRDIKDDYANAYTNGWNGVMAWTSNGVDNCGSIEELEEAVNNMRDTAGDKIFP
ncbi:MAG: cellulase family glycosylhydrolase [Oscillospiraceae bacterium]|nr:cellulase family glycosylhydrolase [Oscillospiraceae bacterium]